MSSVGHFFQSWFFPSYGIPIYGGRIQFQKRQLSRHPIPDFDGNQKAKLIKLISKCSASASDHDLDSLAAHEDAINQIVYRLFDLTDDEIALIESTLTS